MAELRKVWTVTLDDNRVFRIKSKKGLDKILEKIDNKEYLKIHLVYCIRKGENPNFVGKAYNEKERKYEILDN